MHARKLTAATPLLVGCTLAAACLAGCAYRVTPPPATLDDASVFILDYGYHASLLVPRGDERGVEYAYGQWDWFALNQTQWWRALPTLLIPGRGAQGRQERSIPMRREALERALRIEAVYEVRVPRAAAEVLDAALDERFAAAPAPIRNEQTGMDMTLDPQAYSLLHHCNTRVARWLDALGCDVKGGGLEAEFQFLERPPAPRRGG